MKRTKQPSEVKTPVKQPENGTTPDPQAGKESEANTHPYTDFTKALAHEIVRNISAFGRISVRPFSRTTKNASKEPNEYGDRRMLLDSSILIDGRIVPVVNSGIMSGTLLVPQFIIQEVQHIADSSDPVRRTKGRRGLEVLAKLRTQKVNKEVKLKVIEDNPTQTSETDQKLIVLSKQLKAYLVTTDYNLAQAARVQKIHVFNLNDLAIALKSAIVPGEEVSLRITHEGKEREQGVGYLSDGTMIIVEGAKRLVDQDCIAVITKIHQTPAGHIFFARLK